MKLLTVFSASLLIFLWPQFSAAQEVINSGSRVQALAGASVALSGGWSVYGNQAGLSAIDRIEIGGAYLNQFLVHELSVRTGYLAMPFQSSVFALSINQFGEFPYRHDQFGFAYARNLSEKLRIGIQFNYYRLLFPEENRLAGSSGLELGAQYLPGQRLVFGVHLINPYRVKIRTGNGYYRYASRINAGVLYHYSESLRLMSELESGFTNYIFMRSGLEYDIRNQVFLRCGVSRKPYHLCAGFGFHLDKLSVDLATSYHTYLGHSPSVSFQYRF
jgi:hypothetical protein